MFASSSRYAQQQTYTVTTADGRVVTARATAAAANAHPCRLPPRGEGDRLDLLAARYLKDATAFWRLCDANNAPAPDALAARPLIGIPKEGSA